MYKTSSPPHSRTGCIISCALYVCLICFKSNISICLVDEIWESNIHSTCFVPSPVSHSLTISSCPWNFSLSYFSLAFLNGILLYTFRLSAHEWRNLKWTTLDKVRRHESIDSRRGFSIRCRLCAISLMSDVTFAMIDNDTLRCRVCSGKANLIYRNCG